MSHIDESNKDFRGKVVAGIGTPADSVPYVILFSMKMKKITRLLCCALAAALLLAGCQKQGGQENYNQKAADLSVPNSGANDLTFNFDTAAGQFTITDSRNGKVWSNGLTDEYYGQEIINQIHKRNKMSLYSVTYKDPTDLLIAYRNTDAEMETTYEQDGNRVTAHCSIVGAEISFDIVFELKANTLVVSIPADKIQEGEYNKLVTIELLPYLGASIDTEDGYILFPDGSGALYEFKETAAGNVFPYQVQVYGNYFYDYEEYLSGVESGIKTAMLPVFGIKQGNGAILGTITKGQADTSITLSPSGYIYKASRVSPTFNYRYAYSMETVNEDDEVIMYEENRSTSDFEVQYTFLAGDMANYSGMAQTYREFLLDNGMLNQSDDTASVSLDFLLSLKKPLLLWSENVSASTFDGGLEILKTLQEKNISNVKLNLLGWQSNGYNIYPSHFPVSKASGGAGGLKNLLSGSKELNALVALNDNFFLAQDGQGGYSKRDDVASSVKNEAYTDEDEENFLLDFRSALEVFENQWVKKAKDNQVEAVNLDDIARLIYANGAKKNPLRRTQAEVVLSEMLETAKNNFSHVSVSGGNLYGLKYADFLYDIPESSSKDFLFDRDVPFFQMVVHGYIPYVSEIPGNFSDNYTQTVLKWAEYGFVPYYSISESSASILKDCYSKGVFVSKFEDIQSRIEDTVTEFNEKLGVVQKAAITSHNVLDSGLTEVVYDNGATVLVNYSSNPIPYHDITVEAESFTVVQ